MLVQKRIKVVVAGACGKVGQPLLLLLKQSSLISELCIYCVRNAAGVACDLSHIDTPALVTSYDGPEPEHFKIALKNSDIVIITANKSNQRAVSRDDLFKTNAIIIKQLVQSIAEVCPNALVGIITNPINSLLPLACEVLKRAGKLDPNRVFGITTLDVVRAKVMYGREIGENPQKVQIPVVGGHAGITILPLLSQATPSATLSIEQMQKLTKNVQEAGTEVYKAKEWKSAATLSMAHAAAIFTLSLVRALRGEQNIIECAYVQSNITEAKYFANPLLLGKNGIEKNLGLGEISDFEQKLITEAIPELNRSIKMAEDFLVKHL